MNVDGSLANLIQGVSQQSPRDRLPGQCSLQENAVADVVEGWKRRPPTEFVAKLVSTVAASSVGTKFHFYDTGVEQYILAINNGWIDVFDLLGNRKTVTAGGISFYLFSSQPSVDISAVTIGDYTIIANKAVTPALSSTVTAWEPGALVTIKSGEYGRVYNIIIDNAVAGTYTTFPGNEPITQAYQTGTEYIANQLAASLNANSTFTSTYTVTRNRNILLIKRITGTSEINIQVSDEKGSQLISVVQQSVKAASDLPATAPQNYVVRVIGSNAGEDDYYLKFTQTGATGFGKEGVWRETAQPGIKNILDAATMPHVLVRLPSGNFYFGPLDGSTQETYTLESWLARAAGDEDSNPAPSFIGYPIEFIGAFQDRLYILADEFCTFSATSSYFNFWHKTATALLDDDPINITSSWQEQAILRSATQHNRSLVVMSDKVQFIISARNQPLTPRNATMPVSTAFEADNLALPVSSGENVFFGINYGKFAGVREFYTDSDVDSNNARPITAHVEKYIEGRARVLASSSNLDMLIVLTDKYDNTMYLYEYIWNGPERLQSAWSSWKFKPGSLVLFTFFRGSRIYIVYLIGAELFMDVLDFTDPAPTGLDFNVYLDSRFTRNPAAPSLQVTAPYSPTSNLVAVQGNNCAYPGMRVPITSIVGTTITLSEDPGGDVIFGIPMTSRYVPTMPILRDQNGVAIGTARLTIGHFLISYQDTGTFKVKVRNPYYPETTQEFTGRTVGATTIGELNMDSGSFKAGIRRVADETDVEIMTDSYLPLRLIDIEWVGQYTKKGRRV